MVLMVFMVFMVFWGFKVPKQTVAWLGDCCRILYEYMLYLANYCDLGPVRMRVLLC